MKQGFSLADYRRQILALLPVGSLWESLKNDTVFSNLIDAIAAEFRRIDGSARSLLGEIDPRTSNDLFPEWEVFAGLPDPCVGELKTMPERRAAVVSKLTGHGGQSPQYYIDLAAALGFTITISEYDGINQALVNQYYWQVNSALTGPVVSFDMNSAVNEPLRSWSSNSLLECMINRLKPAHTTVLFSYT